MFPLRENYIILKTNKPFVNHGFIRKEKRESRGLEREI